MASLDVGKWARQYHAGLQQNPYTAGRGLQDVNLSKLKLTVKPDTIQWQMVSNSTAPGPQRRVTVSRNPRGADVFGHLQTSKESEIIKRVTLEKGVVEGLNRYMKLPAPPQIQEKVGKNVEIDPSKPHSEGPGDKMTINVTTGQELLQGATASATVSTSEGEYEGYFTCKVSLTGKILYLEQGNGVVEQTVGEVFRTLKESYNGMSPELDTLGVEKNEVVWPMEGRCHFRWNFQQDIKWD